MHTTASSPTSTSPHSQPHEPSATQMGGSGGVRGTWMPVLLTNIVYLRSIFTLITKRSLLASKVHVHLSARDTFCLPNTSSRRFQWTAVKIKASCVSTQFLGLIRFDSLYRSGELQEAIPMPLLPPFHPSIVNFPHSLCFLLD